MDDGFIKPTTEATVAKAPPTSGGWVVWLMKQAAQVALSALVLVGAALGARWLVDTAPETPRAPIEEPVYRVETVRLEAGAHRPTISAFGAVEARRTVELRALVEGAVVETHPGLMVGERIPAGTALVKIDPFVYSGALLEAKANLAEVEASLVENRAQLKSGRAELARAREQLTLAERDLERSEALVERNAANERSVDDRRLVLSQRRQAVEVTESAISLWEARITQREAVVERARWRVEQAERNLDDTVLRAPFDAVVRREAVEPGRRIGANDLVAELYEEGALDVRFTVSDNAFGDLLEGERMSGDALIGRRGALAWRVGDETVESEIVVERIGPEVRSELGGVELIARIEGDAAERLRPGAFVTVALPGRRFEQAFVAPETAIYDRDHVFAVRDGRLERRPATILAWRGETVFLSGDLDGVEVLTTRLTEAGDGVRVVASPLEPASDGGGDR